MSGIIQTIAIFMMGVAAGYTWRDRISQARRARERERRERRIDVEAKASAKYIRVSPRKMRRSVDLIRGRHVEDARRILRLSPLGSNRTLIKVLESAVANAEQRAAIPENLVVAKAWVDEGPTLKRFHPRAYGRATQVRKRTSHVTVVVESLGEVTGGTQG